MSTLLLTSFQNQSTDIPYGSTRPIVSTLDPDAPLREGKPLHDIDMVCLYSALQFVMPSVGLSHVSTCQFYIIFVTSPAFKIAELAELKYGLEYEDNLILRKDYVILRVFVFCSCAIQLNVCLKIPIFLFLLLPKKLILCHL
jgi:hypothetical protein